MNAAAPPAAIERTVEWLLASPPLQPPAMRRELRSLVERLVNAIAEQRRYHERDISGPTRVEFAGLMKELYGDLLSASKLLVTLCKHSIGRPWIGKTLEGEDGVLSALGGIDQIRRLLLAADHAKKWQEEVKGSGRFTLAEALGEITPEMLCAACTIRLRQLLRWPRGNAGNQQHCELCERLWLAAGGAPSARLSRWLAHLSIVKGYKNARANSRLALWLFVNDLIGPSRVKTIRAAASNDMEGRWARLRAEVPSHHRKYLGE